MVNCNLMNRVVKAIFLFLFVSLLSLLHFVVGGSEAAERDRYAPALEIFDRNGNSVLPQTMSQFKSLVAADIMKNPNSFYRNPQHLRMILQAMFYSPKILITHRRHSDRSFESHLIGSAGCAVAAGLNPYAVAALGVHGLYIKHWSDKSKGWSETMLPCELRNKVRQFVDPGAEQFLWLFTGLLGHGPNENVMIGIYEKLKADPNSFDDEDKQLILATLCDEFDEHISGEQWWSDNFKKRTQRGYEAMIDTARLLGNDFLVKLGQIAFHSTQALFPVGSLQPVNVEDQKRLREAVTLINDAAQVIGDKRK